MSIDTSKEVKFKSAVSTTTGNPIPGPDKVYEAMETLITEAITKGLSVVIPNTLNWNSEEAKLLFSQAVIHLDNIEGLVKHRFAGEDDDVIDEWPETLTALDIVSLRKGNVVPKDNESYYISRMTSAANTPKENVLIMRVADLEDNNRQLVEINNRLKAHIGMVLEQRDSLLTENKELRNSIEALGATVHALEARIAALEIPARALSNLQKEIA